MPKAGETGINKGIVESKKTANNNVPIADAERGTASCPFMYTNNLSLLLSRSHDDL